MDDQNKSMNERWAPPTDRGERGYATDPGFSSSSEYTSRPDFGTTTPDDDQTERRTAEIRSDIERTRADLGETVDAIQDRLRPGNMASRAAESVRDATVGRVQQLADRVTHRSRYRTYDSDGGGFVDRVRDNPVPAAIAAISLGWLAFGGRRQSSPYRYRRGTSGVMRDRETFIHGASPDLDRDVSSEDAAEWREWDDVSSASMGRAQGAPAEVGDRMRYAARDVRRRGERLASDRPFATGIIAAAVGLAIGLALPETERENEVLGEMRDTVVDRGREVVRSAAERVQDAAGEVQRVAGEALKGTNESATNRPNDSGRT
jgi:ElaB/YqjD/DUF883 family membrane-anchored ribosome-binding protein